MEGLCAGCSVITRKQLPLCSKWHTDTRWWCVQQKRIDTEKLNNICEKLCVLKDER